jgi:LysR family transcriptional regulator (chromosome initiation inhibitor)
MRCEHRICWRVFPQGMGPHDVLAALAALFNRKDGLHSLFLERLLDFKVKN